VHDITQRHPRRLLTTVVCLCLLATGCGDLIEIRPLRDVALQQPRRATVITDATGAPLATLDGGRLATPVALATVAPVVTQAVIAVEDHRFRRHAGIDLRALGRALIHNVRRGEVVEGRPAGRRARRRRGGRDGRGAGGANATAAGPLSGAGRGRGHGARHGERAGDAGCRRRVPAAERDRQITTRAGEVLYERPEPRGRRVLEQRVASQVTAALREVVRAGTGTRADVRRPLAGKTGTTQDGADAWFAGYTPDVAAAVWIGFHKGRVPMMPPRTRATVQGGTWPGCSPGSPCGRSWTRRPATSPCASRT
jgi:membrane peptidoglycan carboxypeptidase